MELKAFNLGLKLDLFKLVWFDFNLLEFETFECLLTLVWFNLKAFNLGLKLDLFEFRLLKSNFDRVRLESKLESKLELERRE